MHQGAQCYSQGNDLEVATVKQIGTIKERPHSLHENNEKDSFLARPHPAKFPACEKGISRKQLLQDKKGAANVVKEGKYPFQAAAKLESALDL